MNERYNRHRVHVAPLHAYVVTYVLGVIGCYLSAPRLAYNQRREDEQRWQENRERQEKIDREHRAEWQARDAERAKLREAWIAENGITLYETTHGGITVVQSPKTYEANKARTEDARLNEDWMHGNVLLPDISNIHVYANNTGLETFRRNAGIPQHESLIGEYITGKLSDKREFGRQWNITFVPVPDIFVPFASNSVIPHDQLRKPRVNQHMIDHLIMFQVPEHLRPL